MQTPTTEKQIEFTQDRVNWHDGKAVDGDLFYRTRVVVNGEPTEWKEFVMPSCFVDTPVWVVWEMMKDLKPYPTERYDRFEEVLGKVKKLIEA